jgi:hypothetical protein
MPPRNSMDVLEQPAHDLAEGFHRVQGFFVLLDLAFGRAGAYPQGRETDGRTFPSARLTCPTA